MGLLSTCISSQYCIGQLVAEFNAVCVVHLVLFACFLVFRMDDLSERLVIFDIKGVVHSEFVSPGQTVSQAFNLRF